MEYDPTHWNANGSSIGNQILNEKFREYYPEFQSIKKSDYEITSENVKFGAFSYFRINKWIPVYTLKEKVDVIDESENNVLKAHDRYFTHYVNKNIPDNPKLLFFCDSYFYGAEEYYYSEFSEVTFLHNSRNINRIQEFIDYYQPDVVVFENVERVIDVDYDVEKFDSVQYK